ATFEAFRECVDRRLGDADFDARRFSDADRARDILGDLPGFDLHWLAAPFVGTALRPLLRRRSILRGTAAAGVRLGACVARRRNRSTGTRTLRSTLRMHARPRRPRRDRRRTGRAFPLADEVRNVSTGT